MNDKDRDLIEQVLKSAGTAGTQGWEYLVRYMIWDGVVSAITCAALAGGAGYLLQRVFAWKPEQGDEQDVAYLIRGIAIVALIAAAVGFTCGIADNIVQILAPQGAAIHTAIH